MLHPSLSLFGPNAGDAVKAEVQGLRLTLPTNGRQTYGWGVVANFGMSGDFEVTADYELLAVDRPKRGSGAGVALLISKRMTKETSEPKSDALFG